jgi:hypothetical protein
MDNLIPFWLSDREYLITLIDLEDMGLYEVLRPNLKFREHLLKEKKALCLQHLEQEN